MIRRTVITLISALALAAAVPAGAFAGTANAGLPGVPKANPLADMTWGYYKGTYDNVYPTYEAAKGTKKALLANVALRPEAYWFGNWNKHPKAAAQSYIRDTTQGNSDILVQMTDFRLAPWEHGACGKTPTKSSVKSYKSWTNNFAKGIGAARVALVLQPDLPVAGCIHSRIPRQLVAYAAKKLSGHKHTDVYIDVGAADWLGPKAATKLLLSAGIRHARGFALNATHYDSTARQITYGQQVVTDLAHHGVKGRHFVIDTAENGRPFTHQSWHGTNWANSPPCKTKQSKRCVTFGIPPTWDVGNPEWHLGSKLDKTAVKCVDGYLWFGRPWLKGQKWPFDVKRTEQMARTTPFPYSKYPSSQLTGQ